jgi:hypothetical protein
MKNMGPVSVKVLFFLLVGALIGCQQDGERIITPPADQVINAELKGLVERVGLNDGSSDNIIDGASCIMLVFPFDVVVNGMNVSINSSLDFETVEDILNDQDNDDDEIEIQFPITVILQDHGRVSVESQNALNTLVDECVEGGLDDDIECLDFTYPIKVSVYRPDTQVADVVTINNDEQLYTFFKESSNDDLLTFVFPFSVTVPNGTNVSISNNSELMNLIKDAIGKCDEDDDGNDDIDDKDFTDVLTNGQWVITYYFHDDTDQTEVYEDFTFIFATDGTFTADNGTTVFEGEWDIESDDDELELELDFEDDEPSLDELDEDWILIDFNQQRIRLQDSSDGDPTFLTFERP